MQVETSRHNIYTYLRKSNEIVANGEDRDDYVWTFEPLYHFSSMPEVDMVIISVTEQCNLRCTYCCYSGKYPNNRSHSSHSMSESSIDAIYGFIKENVIKRPFRIAFYGGEPLTRYGLMQYAVERGRALFQYEITFSVSTNATLLSNEKLDWFVTNGIKLDISLDGTAAYHDVNRVDMTGKGTFSRVRNNLLYIKKVHPQYVSEIRLLMTLPSVKDLAGIAYSWHTDVLLREFEPASISGIAPNFVYGVERKDFETLKKLYLDLLDLYEENLDWLVLKAFFDECIAYWKDRPIIEVNGKVPMSTCMPRNTKLYIDVESQIGVCEKMSDKYRIGSIAHGVDFDKANALVAEYYKKRVRRCAQCPAIRMCDLCLTAVEFNEEQWETLCHNEKVYAQLYMLVFCEMAERGMLYTKQVPLLKTERCTLSEITGMDKFMLREIVEDAETKLFLPELYEVVKCDAGISQFLRTFRIYKAQEEGILWGVHLGKRLIGFIAIMDISSVATIFYAMHPQYRNMGFMKECIQCVLTYMQNERLCKCINSEVYCDNVVSLKILLENGFIDVGCTDNKVQLTKELIA